MTGVAVATGVGAIVTGILASRSRGRHERETPGAKCTGRSHEGVGRSQLAAPQIVSTMRRATT